MRTDDGDRRLRDILTRPKTSLAEGLKSFSRKVGKVGSRIVTRFGLPTQRLRRFQRRIYVSLDNMTLRDRISRGELSKPRDRERLEALEQMIEDAFSGLDKPGAYVEFGVYFGRSLVHAHRAIGRLDLVGPVMCVGFDSFEGMPKETAREPVPWVPGEYRSTREFAISYMAEQGVDLTNVRLVKDWFSETLNDQTARRIGLREISVAMIDCDIYSATKLVLEFCAPRLSDTSYLFFDDWSSHGVHEGQGQQRAFREFLKNHRSLSTAFVGSYSSDSAVFEVRRENHAL